MLLGFKSEAEEVVDIFSRSNSQAKKELEHVMGVHWRVGDIQIQGGGNDFDRLESAPALCDCMAKFASDLFM